MSEMISPPDRASPDAKRISVRVLPDGRMTRQDAARYLGFEPKTLAMWHMQGKGPRAVRVGGAASTTRSI